MSNAAEIDNDGLNTVALAFNLGLQFLHLVAVEGVGDILRILVNHALVIYQMKNLPDGC